VTALTDGSSSHCTIYTYVSHALHHKLQIINNKNIWSILLLVLFSVMSPIPSPSTPVGVRNTVITRLSVCFSVREHISWTAGTIHTKFCVQIPVGHGSVLLRRRCATLCTSGFMDNVMFGCNGREASKGWQHSASAINYIRDRGGVWRLWMSYFYL